MVPKPESRAEGSVLPRKVGLKFRNEVLTSYIINVVSIEDTFGQKVMRLHMTLHAIKRLYELS